MLWQHQVVSQSPYTRCDMLPFLCWYCPLWQAKSVDCSFCPSPPSLSSSRCHHTNSSLGSTVQLPGGQSSLMFFNTLYLFLATFVTLHFITVFCLHLFLLNKPVEGGIVLFSSVIPSFQHNIWNIILSLEVSFAVGFQAVYNNVYKNEKIAQF